MAEGSSLPRYHWQAQTVDPSVAATVARRHGLPVALGAVLAARGFHEPDTAGRFLDPRLTDLGDPWEMPGMAAAARRLLAAVRGGERVTVFGDFDADGVVAAHVLADVLRRLGADVRAFLPHRLEEGYGLTPSAVQRCLRETAPALLVTVDCGMGANEAIRTFRGAGVDVLITDHHAVTHAPPDDCLVVNPNLPGTPDAARHLCGAGVAFKLCRGLIRLCRESRLPQADGVDLREWLDRLAIATVADVVPLLGENRIIVAAGLSRLRRRPSIGLAALMQRAGVTAVESHHLGFVLGPRLNAAGRMQSAGEALALLDAADADQALRQAILLEQLNDARRQTEADVVKEAGEQLLGWFRPDSHGAVVVGGRAWHPGTLGIVAARLCEAHARPAAVIALDADGSGRGSVRAGHGYDAVAALRACGDDLERYGGHGRAGGFSLRAGCFESFRERFGHVCCNQAGAVWRRPPLTIDAWLGPEDISDALWQGIRRLEPCGEGNPRPRWGLPAVALESARPVGKSGEHLRLVLRSGSRRLSGVWFRQGSLARELMAAPADWDVVFELQENVYQGSASLDLHVVDMRPAAG